VLAAFSWEPCSHTCVAAERKSGDEVAGSLGIVFCGAILSKRDGDLAPVLIAAHHWLTSAPRN